MSEDNTLVKKQFGKVQLFLKKVLIILFGWKLKTNNQIMSAIQEIVEHWVEKSSKSKERISMKNTFEMMMKVMMQ